MKKSILITLYLVTGILFASAQMPEQFNYQGVLRNSSDELITNTNIGLRISLLEGSSNSDAVYIETHNAQTNNYGQFTIEIGNGNVVTGDFSNVKWSSGQVYLKTEVDESGGSTFTELSTVLLLTVPYALYAKDVENKDDADASPENEIQDLSLANDILKITNNPDATEINLAPFTGNNTDEQELVLNGDTLSITNGNQIVLPYDSSNWVIDGTTMYYNEGKVGIGSSAPVSNLEVKANTSGTDALFQVINASNDTVFAVYPDGVKIFVNQDAKGKVGGFAISGRSPNKAAGVDILKVTIDSTRIYVSDTVSSKGKVGGFAISGRSPNKGVGNEYLVITPDSTRIYINDTSAVKGKVGGFAISGRSPNKGLVNDYLQINKDSTRVYISESTSKGKVGGFAISGRSPNKGSEIDYFNVSGNQSVNKLNPSEPRIYWYPKKEAFLTGRVLIESPDSVGTNSMATGYESKAIGNYSQAMGYKAVAKGDYSTAIGDSAVALGVSSFSFGDQTFAQGDGSYAFGKESMATGEGSYAFGLGCISNGTGAITMGTENTSSANYSFAAGRSNIANKTGATALGHLVTSSGDYSTALGYSTTASSTYSTALGYSTTASGSASTALGFTTQASASYSTALGYGTIASGYCSIAMGVNSTSTGSYTIALGYDSHTNLDRLYSTAIGYQCNTNSGQSFAAGSGATAGNSSLAYGMAYALGYNVSATGGQSICLGVESTASGYASRAIGYHTQANSDYSTSIGHYNVTNGTSSTAMGYHTQADSYYEFVVGCGNVLSGGDADGWVDTDPLFVVGNSPNLAPRSNALTVYKNGNLETSGNIIGAYGVIAQSTDEWLRLNPDGSHTNGVYTPGILRADLGLYVGDDEYFYRANEDIIGSADNLMITGEIRQSASDYGDYEIQTSGQIYANDYIIAMGGIHVGGTLDPGNDNLYIDGCVGIGAAPITDKLYVNNGTTYGAYTTLGWQHSSDRRLKTNIEPIKSSLDKIRNLQGVYFNWKNDMEKRQIGLIAQDVEPVLPEVVSKNDNGYYSISYGNLSPLIIEAIKEQQNQIEELKEENEVLKQKLDEILKLLESK